MRGVVSLAVTGFVATTGCDLVIPLTERELVEATVLRSRTTANPDGTFVHETLPFPGEDVAFVVEVEGGVRDTPTLDASGTLRFLREPGRPYRIVTTIDGRILEIQHAAREIEVSLAALGRLDRTRITATTTLQLQRPAGISFLMSTGLWARAQLTADDVMTDPVVFDWRRAGSYSGPLGLLDAARGDRLYYLVFQLDPLQTYYRIDEQLVIDDLTMTNGGSTAHGPLVPAVHDRCARVIGANAINAQRLAAATDGIEPVGQWSIEASVESLIPLGLQLLAFTSDPRPLDIDATVSYGNPFPHTIAHVQVATSYITEIMHPFASAPLRRRATLIADNHPLPATGDCAAATVSLATDVAIATDYAINGIALAGSPQEIDLDRANDVEVTWGLDGDRVDSYLVTLFEVQRSATNETTLRIHREFLTVEPKVRFDPDVLARGDHYVLQVTATIGTPNARTGDFRPEPTGAYTVSQTMSRTFVVR